MYSTVFQQYPDPSLPHASGRDLPRQVGSLFQRIQSCLLQFGAQCHPWVPQEQTKDWEALQLLARWQQGSLEPLADIFECRDWSVPRCRFPAAYASYHDVSLTYLLQKIEEDQQQLVREIASVRRNLVDAELHVCLSHLLGEQRLILAELRNLASRDQPVLDQQPFAETPMVSQREKPISQTRTTALQVSA